MPIKVLYT